MDVWNVFIDDDGNKGVGDFGGFIKYVLYLIGIYNRCI